MNLKTFKLLSSVLIILFITNSCKKGSNPKPVNIDLNGVYKISNIINLSPQTMYTANGQVTDQAVIDDYIRRKLDTNYYFIGRTTIPSFFSENEIRFNAEDSVTWSGTIPGPYLVDPAYYFPYTTPNNYIISQRSSNGFVLEAVDSIKAYPKADYGTNRARMLFDNSNTLKVLSNCSPIMCVVGNCYSNCTYRTAYPFIIKGGQIYLSLYACSISCSQSGAPIVGGLYPPGSTVVSSSAISASAMIGSFDMALTKQLIPGDTILFQNQTIQFSKE